MNRDLIRASRFEYSTEDLHRQISELKPEYMYPEDASAYLLMTTRKLAMLRKAGLIRYAKTGKTFVYKRSWLDEFMETWSGYDLSSPEKISTAIRERTWRLSHGYDS